jgi:hypothetical protein
MSAKCGINEPLTGSVVKVQPWTLGKPIPNISTLKAEAAVLASDKANEAIKTIKCPDKCKYIGLLNTFIGTPIISVQSLPPSPSLPKPGVLLVATCSWRVEYTCTKTPYTETNLLDLEKVIWGLTHP